MVAKRGDPGDPLTQLSELYEQLPNYVEATHPPFDVAAGFDDLTRWMQRNSDLVDPEVFAKEAPPALESDKDEGPRSKRAKPRRDWWAWIRTLAGVDAVRLSHTPEDKAKFNALAIVAAVSSAFSGIAAVIAADAILGKILPALLLGLIFLVLQSSYTTYALSRFSVQRSGGTEPHTLRGARHLLLLQVLVTLPLACALALLFFGEEAVRASGKPTEPSSLLEQLSALLGLIQQDFATALIVVGFIIAVVIVIALPLLVRQLGGVTTYDRRALGPNSDDLFYDIEHEAQRDAASGVGARFPEELVAQMNERISARLASREAELEAEYLQERLARRTHRPRGNSPDPVETSRVELLQGRLIRARENFDRLRETLPSSIVGPAMESRRSRLLSSGIIYGGAAIAEVGLNSMAFQLMGGGPLDTAVLAASVVFINVLLPKQVGELVAKRSGGSASALTAIASAILIWVGASGFVAIIRAAYIEQATRAIFTGSLAFLADILNTPVLTVGWLLVVIGIGTVVAIHSATAYQPAARSLRYANAHVEALERELYRQRARVGAAQSERERVLEKERKVDGLFEARRREAIGRADELRALYEHHLMRSLAKPAAARLDEVGDGVSVPAATPIHRGDSMAAHRGGSH